MLYEYTKTFLPHSVVDQVFLTQKVFFHYFFEFKCKKSSKTEKQSHFLKKKHFRTVTEITRNLHSLRTLLIFIKEKHFSRLYIDASPKGAFVKY